MKIGIDLGTSTTLVSRLDLYGKPQILLTQRRNNHPFIPSIVHISSSERTAYVGQDAIDLSEMNPNIRLLQFFKREFGKENHLYETSNGKWFPEGVAALLLKKIFEDIEIKEGNIEGAVITVPALFDEEQKQAVLDAAKLIDLPILDLIEEPIAAAYHYNLLNKTQHEELVLVYDLGGGTFDVTILKTKEGKVEVVAKDGINNLGGKEFDGLIVRLILEKIVESNLLDKSELTLNSVETIRLRKISEKFKKQLSSSGKPFATNTVKLKGKSLEITILKEELISIFASPIDRTLEFCINCLKSVNLQPLQVDKVLLVGGGAFTLTIKKKVKELFNLPNQKVLFHEPLKSVSFGAAICASQISSKRNERLTFSNLTEYKYGVKVNNQGKVDILTLIEKNKPVPTEASRKFYKNRTEQNAFYFEISRYRDQYLRLEDSQVEVIGVYKVEGINSNSPVNLKMKINKEGILSVQAFLNDKIIGERAEYSVRPNVKKYLKQQKKLVQNTVIAGLRG